MPKASSALPRITQRLLIRTIFLLIAVGVLFTTYRFFENQKNDFNFGSSSASGVLAATRTSGQGSEAVLIEQDGSIKGTDSYKSGVTDRDLVWRPDGRFLFFMSDRSGGTYRVFRWNPDQTDAEIRTVGARGRSSPTFPNDDPTDADNHMLIISGGSVESLDPKTEQSPQHLPPSTSTITEGSADDEQGGSEALFEALYGKLGTSFSYARWCKGDRYIAAIMDRDGGQVLVLQDMTPKDGKLPKIIPVVAGDHVQFDISPKDGSVVFIVQGFQWPDLDNIPPAFVKGNHITTPFRNLIGFFDPDQKGVQPIAASVDDKVCFGSPAVSPDGSMVVATSGTYDQSSASLTPKFLISFPVQRAAGQAATRILPGEVYEPSWSPDGKLIAFAMRANGKRDIYTVHPDGSSQINLTGGKGEFGNPKFNPQLKAAPTQ
jgi:Tol biopolymer transport system component